MAMLMQAWEQFHAWVVAYQEQIHWMCRGISPYAFCVAGFAVLALLLWALTKWKEFMMIGLTLGIYVIPFWMSPGPVH